LILSFLPNFSNYNRGKRKKRKIFDEKNNNFY